MNKKTHQVLGLTGAMAMGLFQGTPVAGADVGDTRVLEEVIVTATRRTQEITRVPLAVSVFSAQQLKQRGVSEMSELGQVSSSLFISTTTTETTGTEVRIRGIGSSSTNPGLDPSVGIFIDGIFRSRSGLATGDLLDIQAVEILRGPQGTLFGRNTSAGAISIITRSPEFEWGGYLEGTLENYDGYRTSLGVTGPLVDDKLAFRLSGTYHQRDGYVDDRLDSSRELHDRDRLTATGQLLWQPTGAFDARLILDYKDKNEHCCTADYIIAGPTAPAMQSLGGIVKVDPFAYKTQQTHDSKDEIEEWGLSLETNWELKEGVVLTYLGAYRDADVFVDLDADTSNVDLLKGIDWTQDSEISSHELRLKSESGRFDWLLGAYYYTDETNLDWQLLYGADFGAYFNLLTGFPAALFPEGRGDQLRGFSQEAEGWALFTHNIIELNDDYDLVLGLRFSRDEKDAKSVIINDAIHCSVIPIVPYCPISGIDDSRSEDEPTGTLKLVRNIDSGSLYASYARGYKAGGFNLDRDAGSTAQQFEPELVDTFELGAKWKGADGTLQINSALFYSEFKDFQLNEFNGATFTITNAGEVSSSGLELELFWYATEHLGFDFGVTYAETEFDKHPAFNNKGDSLEGMRVPYAPKWSSTGSIKYETTFRTTSVFAIMSASYMGDHNTNPNLDPETEQDAYTIVNTRLGLVTNNERWELSVWANNLFEEEYLTMIFDSALQAGSYSAFRGTPRIYGTTLRFNF